MEPPISNKPSQTTNPADLTFQVMPKSGGFQPAGKSSVSVPLPPSNPQPEVIRAGSGSRSKLLYIIIAVLAVLAIGVGAYFYLTRKPSVPAPQKTETVPTTRLPKVWLSKYFQKDVCDSQAICGDSADPDSDGLNNYEEFVANTIPTNPDTDMDGLADGDEVNIYQTEPTLKFTDRRDLVQQNNWVDGFQIKNNYDPLTPAIKFTAERKQKIADNITQFGLHKPTTTTLASPPDQLIP